MHIFDFLMQNFYAVPGGVDLPVPSTTVSFPVHAACEAPKILGHTCTRSPVSERERVGELKTTTEAPKSNHDSFGKRGNNKPTLSPVKALNQKRRLPSVNRYLLLVARLAETY